MAKTTGRRLFGLPPFQSATTDRAALTKVAVVTLAAQGKTSSRSPGGDAPSARREANRAGGLVKALHKRSSAIRRKGREAGLEEMPRASERTGDPPMASTRLSMPMPSITPWWQAITASRPSRLTPIRIKGSPSAYGRLAYSSRRAGRVTRSKVSIVGGRPR